ncbi:Planctomycete cytochrome C [Prosthecobacter debontii]|uniref:Planctomycete cytochrome C n=1 Tax=Prosthecobacter debontii TaxID=48467 RepID=A0A1T4YHZ1_9BACT|nr:PSD1 and planctomycete cytochrome C domain-containing protein [Prosthecobacter debontii]SKB00835.1 Planctomycete cytochrome C [Prosthecobacter debontii]
MKFSPYLYALLFVSAHSSATAELSFEKDVRPILKAHCFHCHGEDGHAKGDLDVRLKHFLEKGGESGPSIVPGKPHESLLLEVVKNGEMPKADKKLKPEEITVIEQWITQGAKTLRPEPEKITGPVITEEERAWWSFQPIQRPKVPVVKTARNAVDAFVRETLAKTKLSPSPEADRATLIRRAYFDLIGLPPTDAQVQAFVADARPDAYERLIDDLLRSPQYGERWGRHWLDVVGYADSEGYNDTDTPRDTAWRYRDYVIRAFNADKPFDQFIREQLAGDEMIPMPPKDLTAAQKDLLTATGYLRMAPDGTGSRNDDAELAKNVVLTETVKIVSSSLLGMTVGCAECHDHRYDPIPQVDFYKLRALFEPGMDWKKWRAPALREISLLTEKEKAYAAELEKEAKVIEAELQPKLDELRDWVFQQELLKIPEPKRDYARTAGLLWQKDKKQLSAEQAEYLENNPFLKVGNSTGPLNLYLANYKRDKELADMQAAVAARAKAVRDRKPKNETVRAFAEPIAYGNKSLVPATLVFMRGNMNSPGAAVNPGDLTLLNPEHPVEFASDDKVLPTTGRRLAFAKHLTDGKHPLLARVLVNRFWLHHFGRGLVNTPGDFGTQGEKPSHPALLDWLAAEFMESGWSLKHLHRLMMTSATYRQSSAKRPDAERVDAANALYWRMNVRRLEAETLRDTILATTHQLNLTPYGPPVPIYEDANAQVVVGMEKPMGANQENRRSIYVTQRRSTPVYQLAAFDAPQMEPNCELRNVSTVAPQSLLMMNSAFLVAQSREFAQVVQKHAGVKTDARTQAATAWRLAYGTTPTAADVSELENYLAEQTAILSSRPLKKGDTPPADNALASLCQVLLSSNRFMYVD